MNFLEMVKRLRSEAGVPGDVASVLNQTGFSKKLVEWVRSADQDIQNLHHDWRFLIRDFEFDTVAGTQVYTPTDAGAPELNRWKILGPSDATIRLYLSDEQFLTPLHWLDFKRTYLIGTAREMQGRPQYISIKPDKSMAMYPIPDQVYTLSGEYFIKAQAMAENADEPLYPSEYHMAAVWRALMFYGAYDAADERYSHGQNEYRKVMAALKADQMPRISWGDPLA